MGIEDTLYSDVFTASLIEGRPDEARERLREIGKLGQLMRAPLQNVIQAGAAQLDERVSSW